MKVIICGSRNYRGTSAVIQRMKLLPPDTIVIHGGASGADSLANMYALDLGLDIKKMDADWEQYGKAAGGVRNTQMLKEEPDLVLAFVNDPTNSPGTANMILQALCAGIEVEVHYND